jgi:hypothetical protein
MASSDGLIWFLEDQGLLGNRKDILSKHAFWHISFVIHQNSISKLKILIRIYYTNKISILAWRMAWQELEGADSRSDFLNFVLVIDRLSRSMITNSRGSAHTVGLCQ